MNKEFIEYNEALSLKELGFDEPCFSKFNKGVFQINSLGGGQNYNDGSFGVNLISAPLYQQAFRWFREKYNLQCWVETTGSKRYSCRYDGNDDTGKRWVGYLRDDLGNILFYNTYEESELECLKKLIEIVKNGK
jgi:hypothetical protein